MALAKKPKIILLNNFVSMLVEQNPCYPPGFNVDSLCCYYENECPKCECELTQDEEDNTYCMECPYYELNKEVAI
jgi:hypothetical protein